MGCSVCGECGAGLQKSKVVARWDAGMKDGDAVSLEGLGDAPGLRRDVVRRAVPAGRGNLLVRVGTKKKVVHAIENANRRRRRRQRLYLDLRAAARVRRRRVRRRVLIMFAVMILGMGGLTFVGYFRRSAYGESCKKGHDCRSGLCAESTGFILGKGGFSKKWCTRRCRVDTDCTGGAKCIAIELDDSLGVPTGKTVHACGRN